MGPSKRAPGTIPLADMNVPQLAEAGKALDRAADLHENTSAVCRILHGLVLLEAKRKLGHGKFLPWLKKNFPASFRDGQRRMVAARDFIAAISDPKRARKLKCDRHVAFALPDRGGDGKSDRAVTIQAQQLLLADLASNYDALQEAKLDMANPIVAAATAYVGKRSWTQLLLDLGPAERGGHHPRQGPPETPEEKYQRHAQDQHEKFIETFESVKFRHDDKAFRFATDAEIALACDVCDEFLTAARAWLKTPRRERAAIAAEEAAK